MTEKSRARQIDGRKQMLVYLRPEMITELKTAALVDDRHTYELVEDAIQKYLDQRRQRS